MLIGKVLRRCIPTYLNVEPAWAMGAVLQAGWADSRWGPCAVGLDSRLWPYGM